MRKRAFLVFAVVCAAHSAFSQKKDKHEAHDAFMGYDGYGYEERSEYAEGEDFAEYDGGFTEYDRWLKEYDEYDEDEEFAEYDEKATAKPPVKPPVAAKPPVKPPVAAKPPVKPPVAAKPPVKPPVAAKPPVKPPATEMARSSEEDATSRTRTGPFQVGVDIEGCLSDISGFTGGGGVVLENRFSENIGAGAQLVFYADMPNTTLITLESTAFAALYFPSVPLYGTTQFYVAADAGAAVYLPNTGTPNPETVFSPTVGGTVGIEFSLSNAFYLKLFVRGGYPLLFSGGVGFGRAF